MHQKIGAIVLKMRDLYDFFSDFRYNVGFIRWLIKEDDKSVSYHLFMNLCLFLFRIVFFPVELVSTFVAASRYRKRVMKRRKEKKEFEDSLRKLRESV
jgi:hypothetical protein